MLRLCIKTDKLPELWEALPYPLIQGSVHDKKFLELTHEINLLLAYCLESEDLVLYHEILTEDTGFVGWLSKDIVLFSHSVGNEKMNEEEGYATIILFLLEDTLARLSHRVGWSGKKEKARLWNTLTFERAKSRQALKFKL